jgi:hypothetical protein
MLALGPEQCSFGYTIMESRHVTPKTESFETKQVTSFWRLCMQCLSSSVMVWNEQTDLPVNFFFLSVSQWFVFLHLYNRSM